MASKINYKDPEVQKRLMIAARELVAKRKLEKEIEEQRLQKEKEEQKKILQQQRKEERKNKAKEKRIENIKKELSTRAVIEDTTNYSIAARKKWEEDEEYRTKMLSILQKRNSSEEHKQKCLATKDAKNPGWREEAREKLVARNKDPEFIAKVTAARQEQYRDPEYRKMLSERTKAYHARKKAETMLFSEGNSNE